jgi:hypothetical protein
MARFLDEFSVGPQTRILDVGGNSFNWSLVPVKSKVVVANLHFYDVAPGDVIADARFLPFRRDAFDIVYSNSVIEHVGTSGTNRGLRTSADASGAVTMCKLPTNGFQSNHI